jgi:hypothetical protein
MDTLKYLKITILCKNIVGKIIRTGGHGFSAFQENKKPKAKTNCSRSETV